MNEVFVVSSWTRLGDETTRTVMGVAFSEASARKVCELSGRLKVVEDYENGIGSKDTPLVWEKPNRQGEVMLSLGDCGTPICFYQPIGTYPEDLALTVEELNRVA